MQRFLLDLLHWANSLFPFSQALHWMTAWISEKTAEVQQCSRAAELEESNMQLRMELAAAHTKVENVEHR
jgi:hypothetical protein